MDFKQLLQTMQHIDEGTDVAIDECGEMPTLVQGGPSPDESLNMNLTINSKGANGIRELIDVLKGIDGNEPKDMPSDDDEKLFGTDGSEKAIVIGDDFSNEVDGDAGPTVYSLDALIHQGDKKDRETNKVNGGGNPQVQEALVKSLSSLYEEIKSRK